MEKENISDIEKRITKYLEGANSQYNFPVSEAQLSYPSTSNQLGNQKIISFMKGLQIGTKDVQEEQNDELQLLYWFPMKKGEKQKELKPVSFAAVSQVPFSSSLAASLITDQDKSVSCPFHLTVQTKDKTTKEKMKAIAVEVFGIKDEKEEKEKQIAVKVTRVMCSTLADQSVLKVMIDGIEYSGVKFVNAVASSRTFPVQIFLPPKSRT